MKPARKQLFARPRFHAWCAPEEGGENRRAIVIGSGNSSARNLYGPECGSL
jgi:hypothetical protein